MRFDYHNTDLDDVVRQYVKISKLDVFAVMARNELRTLVVVGSAIMSRPRDIASGAQNDALAKIAEACLSLQEALGEGHGVLLQRSGYAEGVAVESGESAGRAFDLIQRLNPMLDALKRLATLPELPIRRGAPTDARRVIFLEHCAQYFNRWTGQKIAGSRGSRFANFAQALFSIMEIENGDDLSWQIKRMLKKQVAKSRRAKD